MGIQFEYENVGLDTYLVYTLQPDDILDTANIGMLSNNKIDGFCPLVYTQMNDESFLKYNITGKITLKTFLNTPVNKKNLVNILLNLTHSIIEADEYMIEAESLLLDLNQIYFSVSNLKTYLICFPVDGFSNGISIANFFRNLITSITYDSSENCGYMAEIFNFINSPGAFSVESFRTMLLKLDGKPLDTAENNVPKKQVIPVQRKSEMTEVKSAGISVQQGSTGSGLIKSGVQKSITPNQTIPSSTNGFIPPAPPKQEKPVQKAEKANKKTTKPKNGMSFGYLMTHYSKENLEAYKSQKSNAEEEIVTPKPDKKQKLKTGKNSQNFSNNSFNAGFEVPNNQGMQIPGIEVPGNEVNHIPPVAPPPGNSSIMQEPSFQVGGGNGPAQQVTTSKGSFGKTVYLKKPPVSKTTSLDLPPNALKKSGYLIRTNTNQSYALRGSVNSVGRDANYADIAIPENSSVSACHAQIQVRGNSYILTDTNSTNHTFVNGQIIPSSTEYVLKDGDRISFSNEEFRFVIQ